MREQALRAALTPLSPEARDQLRRVLTRDQVARDHVAQQALRVGARGIADLIDLLTLDDEARRLVVRFLAELDAESTS